MRVSLRFDPAAARGFFLIPITNNPPPILHWPTQRKASTMATKQATRTNQCITLKGSTALVTEFFEYSVNSWALATGRRADNSILYQRGVYPSDEFR